MAADDAIMAGGDTTQLSILSNALSGVSLSPGKTRSSSDSSFPSNINHLDSLHSFIKSMESSSPEMAMDEGKVRGPEVLNSKFGEFMDALGVDKDTVTSLQGKEKPLVRRREGAGRKRARFSMKPVKRKSVNDKHQYSSVIPEQDDLDMPSPELAGSVGELPEGINSPINPAKEEIDVEESIVETEKKINEILDELLSKDKETLDGDGAESLLQELFQFKPMDIGKSSGPEFQDVSRTNFRILTEKIPRTRKSVSNSGNVAEHSTGEKPKELIQETDRPSHSVASPTPPRSPQASISLLEKHTLQSNTPRDPPNDVDLSGPKNSNSGVIVEDELHHVSVLNDPSMPDDPSIYVEFDNCLLQVSDIERQRARHAGTSDSALGDNIDAQAMQADASSPYESKHNLLEQQIDMNLNGKTTEGNLCDSNADDIDRNKLADNVGDEVEVSVVEPLPDNEDITKSASSPKKHQSNQVEKSINLVAGTSFESGVRRGKRIKTKPLEYWKGERLLNGRVNVDEVIEVAAEGNHMNMSSTVGEMNTAQNSEKQKSASQKQNCKTKRARGTQRESKAHTLSPSLAAAGTTFESGVRRSKRIKTRPLEFWKGERLLYGRVDDGLKLVGLKYISPAKGDGKLEVKSYVSDEYTKILEVAAAH